MTFKNSEGLSLIYYSEKKYINILKEKERERRERNEYQENGLDA